VRVVRAKLCVCAWCVCVRVGMCVVGACAYVCMCVCMHSCLFADLVVPESDRKSMPAICFLLPLLLPTVSYSFKAYADFYMVFETCVPATRAPQIAEVHTQNTHASFQMHKYTQVRKHKRNVTTYGQRAHVWARTHTNTHTRSHTYTCTHTRTCAGLVWVQPTRHLELDTSAWKCGKW